MLEVWGAARSPWCRVLDFSLWATGSHSLKRLRQWSHIIWITLLEDHSGCWKRWPFVGGDGGWAWQLKQGEWDYDIHPKRASQYSVLDLFLFSIHARAFGGITPSLDFKDSMCWRPQMHNFSGNADWSSRLAYPAAYLTPPFECLISISILICLKLVSGIISKCQNLHLADFPISATLIIHLFRLKILKIPLTPLFLSYPTAHLSSVGCFQF